jgi:hypothetical protein
MSEITSPRGSYTVIRSRWSAGAGRWRWMRLGACVSPVDVGLLWFGVLVLWVFPECRHERVR